MADILHSLTKNNTIIQYTQLEDVNIAFTQPHKPRGKLNATLSRRLISNHCEFRPIFIHCSPSIDKLLVGTALCQLNSHGDVIKLLSEPVDILMPKEELSEYETGGQLLEKFIMPLAPHLEGYRVNVSLQKMAHLSPIFNPLPDPKFIKDI